MINHDNRKKRIESAQHVCSVTIQKLFREGYIVLCSSDFDVEVVSRREINIVISNARVINLVQRYKRFLKYSEKTFTHSKWIMGSQ